MKNTWQQHTLDLKDQVTSLAYGNVCQGKKIRPGHKMHPIVHQEELYIAITRLDRARQTVTIYKQGEHKFFFCIQNVSMYQQQRQWNLTHFMEGLLT